MKVEEITEGTKGTWREKGKYGGRKGKQREGKWRSRSSVTLFTYISLPRFGDGWSGLLRVLFHLAQFIEALFQCLCKVVAHLACSVILLMAVPVFARLPTITINLVTWRGDR